MYDLGRGIRYIQKIDDLGIKKFKKLGIKNWWSRFEELGM